MYNVALSIEIIRKPQQVVCVPSKSLAKSPLQFLRVFPATQQTLYLKFHLRGQWWHFNIRLPSE